MLIIESHISQAPNDKQELIPALASLNELPENFGKVDTVLTDAGYYSNGNAASCEKIGIEPYIPPNREKHNQPLASRVVNPTPLPEDAEPVDKMRNKLKTVEGCKVYAQRKSTVEPVYQPLSLGIGAESCLKPDRLRDNAELSSLSTVVSHNK